jgi:serine/threonine protein kinase
VLLNELLTGKLPPEGVSAGNLEPVIRKCLQMDPANRYQSADELLRALDEALNPRLTARANVRQWLPPGVRNPNPWIAVPCALLYVLLAVFSFSTDFTHTSEGELWINRIFFFLTFLSEILWLGNYRNIWSRLSLTNSGKIALKVVGVVVGSVVLSSALVLIMDILLDIL